MDLIDIVEELRQMILVEREKWIESSKNCKTYERIDNHEIALSMMKRFLNKGNIVACFIVYDKYNLSPSTIISCFRNVTKDVRTRAKELTIMLNDQYQKFIR